MSEDARSTKVRKVLRVANPDSGDSDDASDEYRHVRSNGHTYQFRRPHLHPSSNPSYQQHKPTASQPTISTADFPSASSSHSHQQPPLSPDSAGSQAAEESTPPPTTPTPHAPSNSLDLSAKSDSPSRTLLTPDSITYADRNIIANEVTPSCTAATSRKGKFLATLKAPFGSRPPRTAFDSNSPRRHRASPTAPLQDPNPSPSSYASSSTTSTSVSVPEKIIFVTADSERYTTVDISGAKTGPQIKELIFTKLNVYSDEDQAPLSIYQTEIGSFAIGAALTDDHLLALCRDQGDSKGNLKFFVSHAFAPVHEPSSLPPPPSEIVPPVLPHHMVAVGPLRPKRRSRSRNGSFSSTSEHLPEVSAGYEADLDNPDRETNRTTVRPSQHQIASSLPQSIGHPPSPRRRPSLHYQRPSSPLIQSPESNLPTANSQTSDRNWTQRKEERYPHVLQGPPVAPVAPALSPNRPSFSQHDEPSSLAVPSSRLLHARSGSDAGADREMALRASEQLTDNLSQQFRSRDAPLPPPVNKLRTDSSRENLTQLKELRPSRRTLDDDDASWELVPPGGEQETTRPHLSRSNRQPTSRFRPTSPYATRHNIGNPPSQPPPAPPQAETRLPRPARVPLSHNIFVTWKGEEVGSRKASPASAPANGLRKNFTKSMDNLKLSSPNSQSSRRNMPQLPINRPTGTNTNMNYSHSNLNLSMPGGAKSYDPPRGTFIRPLPAHGNSPDIAPTSSTQYSSRALPYGSNITSPSDPFPRPQSAAGESLTSPTRGYPKVQSPVHGPTLEPGEPARSPRAVSPHRAYHLPGIPGPRPRPTNYSDRSDRSSDIQSGPETSNTTPPRSPISPQSPRYEAPEKTSLVIEPSSPLSPENPITVSTARGSDLTIRQEDTVHFAKMLDGMEHDAFTGRHITEIQPEKQNEQQNLTVPPSLLINQTSSAGTYIAEDDGSDESESGGGTWIVRPEPPKSNIRPPLKVQIEDTGTASSSGSRTLVDARANHSQQLSTQAGPPPSYQAPANDYLGVPLELDHLSGGRPGSTFVDTDSDSWAPRPPPENIYERLEEFFSKQILDKPVFEAASGDTSPTSSEPVAALPPPAPVANVPNIVTPANDKGRIKAKKSIRVVAQEHKKRIDRTSRADPASYANANTLRKRHTKFWGSRLEEVTTTRGASSLSQPESPGQPTTFKWVRGELIGKGTYGRVYLALNATTGEMIAVKQVELPQTASDKNDSRQHTVVQALKLESETLKDLDHPNIVQYLGFEETPTNLSIFLEYVPGGSVGSCLHKHGKFGDNVTRSFTAQILGGLEYLHSKGILHRDLKADNILVEMSGTCKISDFGISKRTEDAHGGAFTAMQGTVFWMAPEVINTQKKGYNFKIDIWSVGCVVLEMWAGMRPWIGEEMVAVMFKLYQSKLPPPVPEDVVLSEDADDFRQKCFAINPEERPSAAELRKHPYLTLPPGWVFTGFT